MANATLEAVKPLSWRTRPLDGTDDVGFDYQVQVVDGSEYSGIFRLQLKGTENPRLAVNGTCFAIPIKVSTLNFYADATEPILFILCDLSKDSDPRRCPAYYTWIHEEVARIQENKSIDSQKTITIHVPVENNIEDTLDVLPVLQEQRRIQQLAKASMSR